MMVENPVVFADEHHQEQGREDQQVSLFLGQLSRCEKENRRGQEAEDDVGNFDEGVLADPVAQQQYVRIGNCAGQQKDGEQSQQTNSDSRVVSGCTQKALNS